LFLVLEIWMIIFAVRKTPLTAAISAGTVVAGLILYVAVRPRTRP